MLWSFHQSLKWINLSRAITRTPSINKGFSHEEEVRLCLLTPRKVGCWLQLGSLILLQTWLMALSLVFHRQAKMWAASSWNIWVSISSWNSSICSGSSAKSKMRRTSIAIQWRTSSRRSLFALTSQRRSLRYCRTSSKMPWKRGYQSWIRCFKGEST